MLQFRRPDRRAGAWVGLGLVCMVVLLAGCTTNATPVPQRAPLPTPRANLFVQADERSRVLYLGLPGFHAATVDELRVASPSPIPTVDRLLARGRGGPLAPTQPPLPAPGIAGLATGALPADHGALSNALDVGVLAEAPLWRLAEEQGKTSAVIGWPHVLDPPQPSVWVARTGHYAEAARHEIALTPLHETTWSGAPTSFTPPAEGRLSLSRAGREIETVWVLGIDTRDDGEAVYDTFLLDLDRSVGPETARLSDRTSERWASLRVHEQAGADFKLLETGGESVVLYQSEAPLFAAAPAELQDAIIALYGFYPPDADAPSYAAGWLSSEDLLDVAVRQTRWLSDVTSLVWRTYAPDLLMASWPAVAQVTPPLLLVDADQPGWQPQHENDLGDVRRRAYAAVDDALTRLIYNLDLSRTTVVAASPHGYAPVHTQIDVVALLLEWELLELEPDGTPNWAAARARVTVEDAIAWLWPAPSVDSPAEFRVARRDDLTQLTDPLTGEQPVANILADDALADAALWTPATREAMFVQLRPGYRFVLGNGEETFAHTTRYGAAGYDPDTSTMAGWAMTTGRGVKPGEFDGSAPRAIDVPATAAQLLDLSWPLRHGRPLDEWLDLP